MWNSLRQVSWIFSLLVLLYCGIGASYTARGQSHESSAIVTPPDAFNKFVGTWVAHGAFMIVSNDGQVQFEARTYTWCGPHIAQPCDSIVKNVIYDGYREQLVLESSNGPVAYGTVVVSNSPPIRLNATITLTLGPGDTLAYTKSGVITLLCGPDALAGTCGA